MPNKTKKKRKFKIDAKTILIIILAFLFLMMVSEYSTLEEEYKNYQHEVEKTFLELQLNLTESFSDIELEMYKEWNKYECYERGKVECYEKGTVNCYEK